MMLAVCLMPPHPRIWGFGFEPTHPHYNVNVFVIVSSHMPKGCLYLLFNQLGTSGLTTDIGPGAAAMPTEDSRASGWEIMDIDMGYLVP